MMFGMDTSWLVWLPASLLATLGVLAVCWKGIKAFVRISDAADKIGRIEHEFSPNSGSSMRDQIDAVRIEQLKVSTDLQMQSADLKIQVSQMRDHIGADAKAFASQDRFNQRIESTLDRIEDHVRGR